MYRSQNLCKLALTAWGMDGEDKSSKKNICWIHPADLFQISNSSVIETILGKIGERKRKYSVNCQNEKSHRILYKKISLLCLFNVS